MCATSMSERVVRGPCLATQYFSFKLEGRNRSSHYGFVKNLKKYNVQGCYVYKLITLAPRFF
jgi:hypothetical protein